LKNRGSQTHQNGENSKKQKIYNMIILDESGSMESIKSNIVSGFNEVIQSISGIEKQFPEQKHFISFITFNGLGIKTHLENQPVNKIKEIDEKIYNPDSITPLYDAIGFSVSKLKLFLSNKKRFNVYVTILTDGLENASKEYSSKQVKELIENLKMDNWTFNYIGTDHDITKVASSISISSTMFFDKNEKSMKGMFAAERSARFAFCKVINEINEDKSVD